jgi:putative DNA primase/helicase
MLSDEMTRRSVRIHLDSGLEYPEEGRKFRHPDLLAWARSRRGELIWAALILARAWIAAGRPPAPRKLGGFESWSEVIGGILENAGVDGFLGNLEELREAGQDTSQADFLRAVHARHGDEPFLSREVIDLGREHFNIGEGTDAELANRVGYRLRELVDRPRGGLVLRRGTSTHEGGRHWTVKQARAPAQDHESSPASPASGASDPEFARHAGHAGHETDPETLGAAWDRLERRRAQERDR